MKALVFLTALSLLSGAPSLAQETPPAPTAAPQTAQQATGRDFFLFSKALKNLRQGQVSSQITMDVQGEGLAVVVRGQIVLIHKASGEYTSEVTVQPPLGGAIKRYRILSNGKTTWVLDLGAKTYALQPVTDDNEFLVRGLLVGLAKTALAKLEPAQLKLLDTPEPTPELATELEAAVKKDDGSLKVRDETLEGKAYRVYDLQPGKEKGVISIYVNPAGRPERLSMVLDQDKLKIKFSEIIKSSLSIVPEGTKFLFTPTKTMKKVKKIDIGNF
ncbi:hypothetical protein [Armatimonas sp.]|uniref:hypothetical protein n=1 Tax=Armatimonas sp. TaxID=1872638 RepID=UPI00286B6BB6|nr:hypothetical protein [Armatimonas sp.]